MVIKVLRGWPRWREGLKMALRGVRGAVTVEKNSAEQIVAAAGKLLEKIIEVNKIKTDDIASIIFSTTPDLKAEFPAVAARALGLIYTPLFCTHEMDVPTGLKKCIRVLMHVNTDKSQKEMKNIYLNKAESLRPDLANRQKDLYYQS